MVRLFLQLLSTPLYMLHQARLKQLVLSMFSTDTRLGVPGSARRLQVVPGIVAKVVKQDGTLAGFNEPGELQVKMPSVALGYVDNDDA